ncbi:MAG: hypothetical protein ACE5HB_08160, partial [Terriglobia bacterium]
ESDKEARTMSDLGKRTTVLVLYLLLLAISISMFEVYGTLLGLATLAVSGGAAYGIFRALWPR